MNVWDHELEIYRRDNIDTSRLKKDERFCYKCWNKVNITQNAKVTYVNPNLDVESKFLLNNLRVVCEQCHTRIGKSPLDKLRRKLENHFLEYIIFTIIGILIGYMFGLKWS